MADNRSIVPIDRIQQHILFLRSERVLIDAGLAELYDVETKTLIQAVKRNIARFPPDFMFQLTRDQYQVCLKSRSVTSKGCSGRQTLPYAFTEQGVVMLSSVLGSDRAVLVNIEIIRAFARLRRMLAAHADLARKLEALERKYDAQFRVVFDAIRQLMKPPPDPPRKRIGFLTKAEGRMKLVLRRR